MSPEFIPYAAAAAGFVAGSVADRIALNNVAEQRMPLSGALSPDVLKSSGIQSRRLGGLALIAPVVLAAGAYLETYAFMPDGTKAGAPSGLEVVVDHSGDTIFEVGGVAPVFEINNLVGQFSEKNLVTEGIVANSGRVRSMKLAEVKADKPFGDAPLAQATQLALDKAGLQLKQRSAGILIITNGNKVGNQEALAAQASAHKTPVFIVNVESAQKNDPALTAGFKKLTKTSEGKYWDANAVNLNDVAKDVKKTLVPKETTVPIPNRTPLKVVGAALLLAGVEFLRKRKDTPTWRNNNGKGA